MSIAKALIDEVTRLSAKLALSEADNKALTDDYLDAAGARDKFSAQLNAMADALEVEVADLKNQIDGWREMVAGLQLKIEAGNRAIVAVSNKIGAIQAPCVLCVHDAACVGPAAKCLPSDGNGWKYFELDTSFGEEK